MLQPSGMSAAYQSGSVPYLCMYSCEMLGYAPRACRSGRRSIALIASHWCWEPGCPGQKGAVKLTVMSEATFVQSKCPTSVPPRTRGRIAALRHHHRGLSVSEVLSCGGVGLHGANVHASRGRLEDKLLSHCLAVIFVYRLWTASDFALLTHHDHNSVLGPPLTTCDASLEVILRPPLALR